MDLWALPDRHHCTDEDEMGGRVPFTLIAAKREDRGIRSVQDLSFPFNLCHRGRDEMGGRAPFTLIAAKKDDRPSASLQNLSLPFIVVPVSSIEAKIKTCLTAS